MAELTMPRLSDTMEQGTVARWLKREGERVSKGEPLVEIETDKANMTLDSYETGVLERIVVHEGQAVPIGQPIAYIATERVAGAPAAAPPPAPVAAASAAPTSTAPAPSAAPSPETAGEEERLKASPIARRMAQEHDIDLTRLTGTGPGGRIVKEDVEGFLAAALPRPQAAGRPPAPVAPAAPTMLEPAEGAGEIVPLTRMQATIARRMAESKTTVPHFYVTNDVGMDAAANLIRDLNAALGGENKVGPNDLVLRAAALALGKFPAVNASYRNDALAYHDHVNIGIAVALSNGLVVPVLRQAESKSLATIAAEARSLVERARTGHLAPADWEGATFTVSNLGKYDVLEFAAIITPPQSAILAVASIQPRPVVIGDEIKIARRMRLTLSVDHRVCYGATAAEFLREMKRLLENPLSLLI